MEVKVVQFSPHHLEVMDVREIDAALFGFFKTDEAYARIDGLAKVSVQAATFLYDGRVLFVAGFVRLWPGVFEVWMLPSVYIKTAPRSFARLIRRYVDRIGEDFKAHRIQTTSFPDEFHERWMKFLGFSAEGVLQNYTQDKRSMVQYGRVF